MTTVIISNKEMEHIVKIVKYFEESSLLKKSQYSCKNPVNQLKMKQKKKL